MFPQIAIPYSAIVDIERSSALDFSETIEVKVVDKGDSYSVDSYFFAYFHDLQAALEQISSPMSTIVEDRRESSSSYAEKDEKYDLEKNEGEFSSVRPSVYVNTDIYSFHLLSLIRSNPGSSSRVR